MTLSWTVHIYRNGGKRLFDLLLSSIALLALAPVGCFLFVLIAFYLGLPATFCQHRLGKHGRRLLLHKFRSMTNSCDESGELLPDEQRLPEFGRFLRSTSLDELPQLFDILRGEMSFVGPRPLLVEYRHRYTQREWLRHAVRPGLTGWTAVNGRSSLSWEEKFALDLYYVENYCFTLDLKILWLTVSKVLRRSNVTPPGEETTGPLRPHGLQGNPVFL